MSINRFFYILEFTFFLLVQLPYWSKIYGQPMCKLLAFLRHSFTCYLHPVLYTLIHPVLYALIPCFQEVWVSVSCDVMAALSAATQHTRLHVSRSLIRGKTTVLVCCLGTGCLPAPCQPTSVECLLFAFEGCRLLLIAWTSFMVA